MTPNLYCHQTIFYFTRFLCSCVLTSLKIKLTLALCRIASTCKSAASLTIFSRSGRMRVSSTNVNSKPMLLNWKNKTLHGEHSQKLTETWKSALSAQFINRCVQRPETPAGFGRPRNKGVSKASGLGSPLVKCLCFELFYSPTSTQMVICGRKLGLHFKKSYQTLFLRAAPDHIASSPRSHSLPPSSVSLCWQKPATRTSSQNFAVPTWTRWQTLKIQTKPSFTEPLFPENIQMFCFWKINSWKKNGSRIVRYTWETAIVVRKCLDEFLSRLHKSREKDITEFLDVQSGGSLDLQLHQAVLDDGTPVVQEQCTRLFFDKDQNFFSFFLVLGCVFLEKDFLVLSSVKGTFSQAVHNNCVEFERHLATPRVKWGLAEG